MKVLQVNPYYAPVGGAEHYLNQVSAHLEQCGLTVAVLYAIRTGSEFQTPNREAVHLPELVNAQQADSARRWERLQQVVEGLTPDVIHVHNLDEPEALAVLAQLRPTIQFVHAHSVKFCPGDGKFYRRTHDVCRRPVGPYCWLAPYLHWCGDRRPWRIAANYATVRRWLDVAPRLAKLMVASQYMKQELMAVGIPADHVVVNPPGVERGADSLGVGETSPTSVEWSPHHGRMVLFVGRLYEAKGPQYLLAALEHIGLACHVVFVGDGPDAERLKQAARKLSPRHTIEFTGWIAQDEVHRFYQQARVVVMPSVWPEPFGLVGIEALSYGKPVVAFDVGGIGEWLKDGYNGFVVAPKDTLALAEAIKTILCDTSLAREMGRRAYTLAVRQFNLTQHVERLVQVYQQVLSVAKERQGRPP